MTLIKSDGESYFQQLKKQIISQIYFGQLASGDRLPAARRLARQIGVNPKTIERIYHRLQDEGYLAIEPRSGTVVRSQVTASPGMAVGAMHLAFLRKTVAEGAGLGLAPDRLCDLIRRYTSSRSRKELSVTVVECNREQVYCFSRQIEQSLRVTVQPLLLNELAAPTRETLAHIRRSRCVATTHYHWDEVASRVHAFGRPMIELRLTRQFFDAVRQFAQDGPVGLIVSDEAFVRGFRRALRRIHPELAHDRLLGAQADDEEAVRALLARVRVVFVSPLCEDRFKARIRGQKIKTLAFTNMIATESLEALETCLITTALEQA